MNLDLISKNPGELKSLSEMELLNVQYELQLILKEYQDLQQAVAVELNRRLQAYRSESIKH